jgi:hypothetical protein
MMLQFIQSILFLTQQPVTERSREMNYSNNHNTEAEKCRTNRSLEVAANSLYNKVSRRGLLEGLKRLFGRKEAPRLFTMAEVKRKIRVQGNEAVGEKTIDLDMVQGTASEGRVLDFDIDFRPLQGHNKDRWLGIAAAWISGRRLGRVKLVQVGDIFFVEDGHHRISVAKAMGDRVIEAEVVRLLGRGILPAQAASERETARMEAMPMPMPT